jgi:hypothetical protein
LSASGAERVWLFRSFRSGDGGKISVKQHPNLSAKVKDIIRRHPFRLAVLSLAAILGGLVFLSALREAETFKVMGPEEIVFDWSQSACEPADIPDIPARAFRDAQGQAHLIASHYISRRMTGPDLDNLTHDCAAIMPSHYDPDPAEFDDREWIHSVYTSDGTEVFALIHNEYQGHTHHPSRCPSGEYFECWYNAVTLAVSTDGGASFEHAQPPTHLVASIPYRYEPDSGHNGIFQPSNIVRNAADGYYYALLRVQEYRDQPRGTCVMRTTDLADPGSWRAWDGVGFNVRFINPYLEPNERPRDHVCQPISYNQIQLMVESLTFNTYLDSFLLVGTAVGRNRVGNATSGIYYSTSDDLIRWTPRKLIVEVESRQTYRCGDPDPVAYPSVLDPGSPSRNFETTRKRAYLYFTRYNYESCEETFDRDLVRVPIEFSK